MGRRSRPRTDFGTVLFHWMLVTMVVACIATGLRIITVSPLDFGWLQWLDLLLPASMVWTAHMPVSVALFGLAFAYAVYVRSAGLSRRILLDRVRLMGIWRGGQARWGAVTVILTWVLFLSLLVQLVTGSLMYIGYGGYVVELHRFGTWALIAGSVVHVAGHWAIGGAGQLLRIVSPSRLAPPAPPFDPFDLLVASQQRAREQAAQRQRQEGERMRQERDVGPGQAPRRSVKLHSHPLAMALAIGLMGMTMVSVVDQTVLREQLNIRRIAPTEAPALDGDISDPVWRTAKPVTVLTNQGANFDGAGTSEIEVRAVHDGTTAYFSFVWGDPTRSLKHFPLLKKADGWHVVQSRYDIGDEHEFHEDKFSVLLAKKGVLLAGDRTFHAGRAPIADKPTTLSGRGLHYTVDGSFVDVWQWNATRGGSSGFIDDGHFGPPAEPTGDQKAGGAPYKGGYAYDPGTANYYDNFEQRGPGGYLRPVQPKRLPLDWRQTSSAMGRVHINPKVGESDGGRWSMTEAESLPFSPELDARYPENALIPGVIIAGEYTGDRADVRGMARWASGRWALEIARLIDTKSPYDVPIVSGAFMRVAAFDRSQIRHTRHIRPIRLEVQ
jgi:hypothetical protein